SGISISGDSVSVLSLQSIASDLQKFDSVEHLSGISGLSEVLSLPSEELGQDGHSTRRFRLQRSLSL
ncbi:3BP5L protein, partial [Sterrhoptilus dennistouni]|nr:3BP5L protein [Sterrhoptilus dennistouni]